MRRLAVMIVVSVVGFAALQSSTAAPPDADDVQQCTPPADGSACAGGPCSLLEALTYSAANPPAAAAAGSAATCKTTAFASFNAAERASCLDVLWKDATTKAPCQNVDALLLKPFTTALTAQMKDQAAKLENDGLQRALQSHNCSSANTLCLGRDGVPLVGASLPKLQEGEKLTVYVLSPLVTDQGKASVTLRGLKILDSTSIVPTQKPAAAGQQVFAWFEVASVTSDATDDTTRALEVSYSLPNDDVSGKSYRQTYEVKVDHGKYFVEFGLAVPFVFRGTRTIMAPATITESTEPRAAISAIVFPLGRAKDRVGYEPSSNFGLQIGTDFDFTKSITDKDYHVGVAYEPIAGFGLGVGLSLVKGAFITGAGTQSSEYLLRPYFTVFLTTKFVSAAQTTIDALHSTKNN